MALCVFFSCSSWTVGPTGACYTISEMADLQLSDEPDFWKLGPTVWPHRPFEVVPLTRVNYSKHKIKNRYDFFWDIDPTHTIFPLNFSRRSWLSLLFFKFVKIWLFYLKKSHFLLAKLTKFNKNLKYSWTYLKIY